MKAQYRLMLIAVAYSSAAAMAVADPPFLIPQTHWVRASNGETTFDQEFRFDEGEGMLPAIASGKVQAGGPGTQEVVKYVPVTLTRTVYVCRFVLVNGRLRMVSEAREEQYTVLKPVREMREVDLPVITGHWISEESGSRVTWAVFSSNDHGTVFGTGLIEGGFLRGSVLYCGVTGIPSGIYTLRSGEY